MQRAESFADFARRLKVARSTVTRAAQAGRLVLDEAGRVLIEPSLQAWHASRGLRDDVAQRHAQARGAAIPHATAQNTPSAPNLPPGEPVLGEENPDATDPATADATRNTWAAKTLHWQNQTMLIELDLLRGRRLDREATLREAQGLGNTLRAAVERLIDQTAPRVAVAESTADRARLLRAEISQVRRVVKVEFTRALRRLGERRSGADASTTQEVKA